MHRARKGSLENFHFADGREPRWELVHGMILGTSMALAGRFDIATGAGGEENLEGSVVIHITIRMRGLER